MYILHACPIHGRRYGTPGATSRPFSLEKVRMGDQNKTNDASAIVEVGTSMGAGEWVQVRILMAGWTEDYGWTLRYGVAGSRGGLTTKRAGYSNLRLLISVTISMASRQWWRLLEATCVNESITL